MQTPGPDPASCTRIPAAASRSAPCWEVRRAWMCRVSMRPLCAHGPLTHPPREAGLVTSLHFTNVETEAPRGLETCLRSHSSPMVMCLTLKKRFSGLSRDHTAPHKMLSLHRGQKVPLSGPTPPPCSAQTPAPAPTAPSAPMSAGTGGWPGPRSRGARGPLKSLLPQISNIQVASGARKAVGGGWSSGRRKAKSCLSGKQEQARGSPA